MEHSQKESTKLPGLMLEHLDTLAERFRDANTCLAVFTTEGAVRYIDRQADAGWTGDIVPAISESEAAREALSSVLTSTELMKHVVTVDLLAGVSLAGFSYFCRRDQQKLCFGLLTRDSEQLKAKPSNPALLIRRAEKLLKMVQDQLRLAELQAEVETLSTQLSNTYEEQNLIYRLSNGMRINRTAAEFFKEVCLDVMDVIRVAGMGVVLRAESIRCCKPMLYGPSTLPKAQLDQLAAQLVASLQETKAAIFVNDVASRGEYAWLGAQVKRLLAVPLQRDDQVLGCLFAIDKVEGEFDTVDLKLLLSIANESAIYLDNAMLFQDVRDLMMGLLHSLVSAVDAKDTYTCGHSERVALIARELATVAGLPPTFVERVYMAGLLHDVGKIGVPEAVLQKPGRLTEEEFDLMKQHPEIGAKILFSIKQLDEIRPGVLHHHERYDGRGYPHKLAGEMIPLAGRVICLADCFDAMTSNRTYRPAMPFEVALLEIRKNAGTQFDPVLADAFLRIGETRLRELTSGHHEQAARLIQSHHPLRVA